MSTTPPGNLPASPTLPLTPDVRAAYQALNDTIESAIEGTTDLTALEALNPWQDQIDDVLNKDDIYRLDQNRDAFNALLTQINSTNTGLKTLQTQINATASHFATAGNILGAISKVLGLLGVV
ncbi:MAG: hypothetical protein WBE38_07485 [Terracidiphilus sp.]